MKATLEICKDDFGDETEDRRLVIFGDDGLILAIAEAHKSNMSSLADLAIVYGLSLPKGELK